MKMETKKKLREEIAYQKKMKEHYQEQSEIYIDMYNKYVDLYTEALAELIHKNQMLDQLEELVENVLETNNRELAIMKLTNGLEKYNIDKLEHIDDYIEDDSKNDE